MPLYRVRDEKFTQLKQVSIAKEKHLQRLVEANLELLDIHMLQTEYVTTSGGRIDTLGVDRNGAPVIIEYKRNQNDAVINQALSYRKWLTGQKPEFFEMLIKKRLTENISISIELDWKRPRIICIAESFNRFDIDTADVLMPVFRVELMTYRFFENDIFQLEPLQMGSERESNTLISKVNQEDVLAHQYSVELHRSHGSQEIQALFDELRSRILALGSQVVERAVQQYIGYRASKNFVEVVIQKSVIKIRLRGINDDPRGYASKVPDARGWVLNYEALLTNAEELDYVMTLVEQSYNDVA